MTQSISIKPLEKGTALVTISDLKDSLDNDLEIGDLISPCWQLMKSDGTIVHERSFASCSLSSLTWVLSGDDLAIFGDSDSGNRNLSFYATYNSSYGTGLSFPLECKFNIQKLLGQVDAI